MIVYKIYIGVKQTMLHKLRSISISFGVVSLVLLGLTYATNSKAEAPHPDGGSTTIDFSEMYGGLAIMMDSLVPYLMSTLTISVICTVLLTLKIRSN